ncbi:sulfatase family protein [Horticoccus sp. 23ND18S-11]|uniref:sulfatase family protein n=1 Tax=Horticoccus sp. 23ND18S-11 TaxID=3391832 RepID=UPI0039C97E8B
MKFPAFPLALILTLVAGGAFAASAPSAANPTRPNIVLILCDDLGYGDVKANNPASKIATPHMDRIAREGVRFSDAHTPSSVCSPTRYGLLTGRYNWRTKLQSGVLGGLSPRLIEPGRATMASMLKAQGYHTTAVGKWHLGMDWVKLPGKTVAELSVETAEQVRNVDYTKPIANGPTSVGFDRYFGISASLDMVPYTFIENDRVTVQPTLDRTWPLHPGYPADCRVGPAAPGFEVEHVLPEFTRQAVNTITERARTGQPFFLYLPLASPHTPIAPNQAWIGKSGLNLYADFVMETDAAVGEVLAALDRAGVADNTLVIFTSDNGCSPSAKIEVLQEKGHAVSGPLRGHKADAFDGGHRVPFFVRWPARVKPAVSDQLVCLTDVFATCAEIVGARLPANAAEDSFSFLANLTGTGTSARESVVHHTITGAFAIRQGPWKLALCPGSGGWSAPRDPEARKQGLPETQLYRIADGDLAEEKNVYAQHPEIVARLTKLLEQQVAAGRTTPGAPQPNAVPVLVRKPQVAAATKAAKKKAD